MISVNRVFVSLFSVLFLFKGVGVIQESRVSWYEAMLPAIMFAVMFGSPQLAWALASRKALFSGSKVLIALLAVVAFVITAVYFGTFPGAGRPSWGGQEHWEVPIALAVEWLIAGVLLLAFRIPMIVK